MVAGTGTFGRVKLARGRSDGQFYALKVLRKEQLLRLKQVQHVLNERRLLAAVDHPNIVKMWEIQQYNAVNLLSHQFCNCICLPTRLNQSRQAAILS